jgi:hypothetical protein
VHLHPSTQHTSAQLYACLSIVCPFCISHCPQLCQLGQEDKGARESSFQLTMGNTFAFSGWSLFGWFQKKMLPMQGIGVWVERSRVINTYSFLLLEGHQHLFLSASGNACNSEEFVSVCYLKLVLLYWDNKILSSSQVPQRVKILLLPPISVYNF